MIHRLPKKYKEKYKKKRGFDEEMLQFALKVIGSTALILFVAVGADIYDLIY